MELTRPYDDCALVYRTMAGMPLSMPTRGPGYIYEPTTQPDGMRRVLPLRQAGCNSGESAPPVFTTKYGPYPQPTAYSIGHYYMGHAKAIP